MSAMFAQYGAAVSSAAWTPESMAEAVATADPTHVFGLLGTTAAKAKQAAQAGGAAGYDEVDVGLTLMLLEAVEKAAPDARFVYMSSLGADGGMRNAYLEARYQVEQRLAQSSVSWTVIRPSFVSGSDRPELRPGERIGAMMADASLGLLGALGATRVRDRYRPISGDRLAGALMGIARHSGRYERRAVEADELQNIE